MIGVIPHVHVVSPFTATKTMESEELPSSSKEDMQMRKNSSTMNINEEQNVQRKKRRYLPNYPASYTYSNLKKWHIFDFLDNKFASQIHMIMVFKNDSALIMSKDRMIYGLGSGKNGQLGLDENDYIQPKKVETLCGKNITTFYCSTDAICIFALTEEGEVYSWGVNEKYRLGRELDSHMHKKIYMPGKIDSLREECITDIASNRYNSLALTDSGKIYIWGDIEFSNKRFESKPCRVKFELEKEKFINIACGESFIMALSEDGKLYSWGLNDSGQLGINSENENSYPRLITSLTGVTIVKVACGLHHSLALTSKGKIYSWGKNNNGQLGHGKITKLEIKPTMLDIPSMGEISDIVAQDNRSVAINKIGCVYIWGLHIGQTIWKPIKIKYSNMYDVFKYEVTYIISDSTKEKSSMSECLAAAFNDRSTSDLTIKVGMQNIHVHKAILKIRCQYFRNMFENDHERSNQSIMEHDDFSYKVCNAFLKYLYTDRIVDDLSLEETFELLKLCNKYNETNFERRCIQTIRENITVSNVALYYAKAIECDIKDLEEFCFLFALTRMADVMLSECFAKLHIDLKYDFLIKAAKAGIFKT